LVAAQRAAALPSRHFVVWCALVGGDKDRWFWTLAVGAALIAVGTIYGSGGKAGGAALRAGDAPAAQLAPAAGDLTERTAAIPAPRPEILTQVYECRVRGHHVFSDERCAADARVRSIRSPSRMDPQDTSILAEPVLEPVRFTGPARGKPEGSRDKHALCTAIETERDAINEHMREGYAAGEGDQLRERLRNLSDLWYERRCRHFR
jgi:hypothetical protein